MNSIEIYNLTKKFGNKIVLDNLNLIVEEDEIFGFLGRNGAGKSTFINVLAGNVSKTSGTFKLLDYNENQINEAKLKVGFMPDVSNLYESMTSFEFLKYMSELKGIRSSKNDLKRLLDMVGLDALPRMKIKSYSFGMKKKLSLAQALIGEPKLVFLDEPTSGIDPESIINIQNLIIDLNKKGTTIFLTSHNLNEIEKVCTNIAILKDGTIKINGSIDSVKKSFNKNINLSIKIRFNSETPNLSDIFKSTFVKSEDDIFDFNINDEEEIPNIISYIVKEGGNIYSVVQNTVTLEEIFLS